MSSDVLVHVARGALWVTINRPERRNAMNDAVISGIISALATAEARDEVRCVVLTGQGEKAFCSGADLQPGGAFDVSPAETYTPFAQLLRAAHAACKPIIARVNGACLAGGMGLLAMADLAVAAPHATFGLPEVKVGAFPMQVLSVLQPLIAPRVLAELSLGGEPIDAQSALRIGLVNRVTDALDPAVDALVERLCANAPTALRRGLYALKRTPAMDFEQALAFTESQFRLTALSEDAREGLTAFREKRPPVWTGR